MEDDNEDDNEYKLLRRLENGISSDVDMSNMPCGINSTVYFFVTQGPYSVIVGTCSYLMKTTTSTSCSACSRRGFHWTLT